jgi:hypothetical protein
MDVGWVRIRKDAVVTHFKVSQLSPGETEENTKHFSQDCRLSYGI